MTDDSTRATTPDVDLADKLLTLQGRIRRSTLAGKTDILTPSQSAILGRLIRDGATTTADLARAEAVRPQSVGATVQALADLGLVERTPDPTDGRRVIVRATHEGATTREHARADRLSALADRLSSLSDDDKATVERSIDIIAKILGS